MSLISLNCYAYKSVRLCRGVYLSAQQIKGEKYMIMEVEADKDKNLLSETVLKFQLNDDSVMIFEGKTNTSKNESTTLRFTGKTMDESVYYLMFPITEEQINQIRIGIKAALITTIPEMYRVKYTSFDFTKELYRLLTQIEEIDEFE